MIRSKKKDKKLCKNYNKNKSSMNLKCFRSEDDHLLNKRFVFQDTIREAQSEEVAEEHEEGK